MINTDSWRMAIAEVEHAREAAIRKHGHLKPGAMRLRRLIREEYEEAMDELQLLNVMDDDLETRRRAMTELAQLAQLCIGAIEIIQGGRVNGVQ